MEEKKLKNLEDKEECIVSLKQKYLSLSIKEYGINTINNQVSKLSKVRYCRNKYNRTTANSTHKLQREWKSI